MMSMTTNNTQNPLENYYKAWVELIDSILAPKEEEEEGE